MAQLIRSLSQQEQLNFLLTNRIPRRLATQFMGWYSGIENRSLTKASLWVWRQFADDLDLEEAKTQEFASLRECFIRELRPGARPIDTRPGVVVSPCDALVGARGDIEGTTAYQAKGFPYELSDLMPDPALQVKYRDGRFITLRLKSTMYHRFHAPLDCRIRKVTYVSGDTWNVNPIALRRIEKLYCKNERAVIDLDTGRDNSGICLVPVAAILVASIRLNCLDRPLDMHYRGPQRIDCDVACTRGEELGYFQHGSTIILFATRDYDFCEGTASGDLVRVGQGLLSDVSQQAAARAIPSTGDCQNRHCEVNA